MKKIFLIFGLVFVLVNLWGQTDRDTVSVATPSDLGFVPEIDDNTLMFTIVGDTIFYKFLAGSLRDYITPKRLPENTPLDGQSFEYDAVGDSMKYAAKVDYQEFQDTAAAIRADITAGGADTLYFSVAPGDGVALVNGDSVMILAGQGFDATRSGQRVTVSPSFDEFAPYNGTLADSLQLVVYNSGFGHRLINGADIRDAFIGGGAAQAVVGYRVETDYSSDDAFAYYLRGVAPADSISIYNYDGNNYISSSSDLFIQSGGTLRIGGGGTDSILMNLTELPQDNTVDSVLVVDTNGRLKVRGVSSIGSGGGATAFTGLTDTPSSYSGQAGKIAKVNVAEDSITYFQLGDSLRLFDINTGVAPGGVKIGKIIDPPTAMATTNRIVSGQVLDMQHIYPNYPFRLGMLCSVDHGTSAETGAYLYLADNPEGPWYSYDAVKDSFDIADFPSKPSGNPVLEHPTASDKGEYFTWYQGIDGKVYAQGHSIIPTQQSQWIAVTENGLNFTYLTKMDYPAATLGNHSFSYAIVQKWKGLYYSYHVLNDVNPIAYGQSISSDGRNWKLNLPKVYERDLTHWGVDTLQLVKVWSRHTINNVDWAIAVVRNFPSAGGQSTEGRLCIFPVSSDGRRITGPGYVLWANGSGADFDSAGVEGMPYTFRDIYGPNPDRVYVYFGGRDNSQVGTVGVGYVTPKLEADSLLVQIDSTKSTTVAIDNEGLPLIVGQNKFTAYEIFPETTDLPLGIIDTFINGVTTAGYTDVSPFEGFQMTTQSGDSQADVVHIFRGFDLADISDIMFTIDGVKVDPDIGSFRFGFLKNSGGTTTYPINFLEAPANDNMKANYTTTSSVYTTFDVRDFGWVSIEDRSDDKMNLTARVVFVPTMNDSSTHTLLQLWSDDQIIYNERVDDLKREFLYPFIAVVGDSVTAEYQKVKVVVGTDFSHTHGGNTGELTFPSAETGGSGDLSGYALLAGRSGGQYLRGGTGSGDDLKLESTSNATKGYTILKDDYTLAGGNESFNDPFTGFSSQNASVINLSSGATVSTNSQYPAFVFNHNSSGTNTIIGTFSFVNENIGGSDDRIAQVFAFTDGATNKGNIQFGTNNGTAFGTRMTLKNNGYLGLGTTTPNRLFHAHQDSTSSASLMKFSRNESGTGKMDGVDVGLNSAGNAMFAQYENADMVFATNNSTRVTIKNDGDIGIGLTSPTAIMHIKSGTATANTAPLKINEGTAMATPEDGAIEHISDNITFSAGTTRYTLAKTLTNTATLDFPNTSANASTTLTITVTGATVGDVVSLGIPNGSTVGNTVFTAWVSAANTVTVQFSNLNGSANDPASGTFRVSVLKY